MYIVAGKFKHRKLATPKGMETRPTTNRLREALFNISQSYIEGAFFLDLFAGSGAMGLESLSRGAEKATFIDNSKASIECIKQNIQLLGVGAQCQVITGDVFQMITKLAQQGHQFDIIYADPPYGKEIDSVALSIKLTQLIDQSAILKPNGDFFLEEDASLTPPEEGLTNLKLLNTRRSGRTSLTLYRKVE